MSRDDEVRSRLIEDLAACQNRVDELTRLEEEKRADRQELLQAKAMFEGLFEFAPDAVIVVDRAGRIVRINRQAERLFGYTARELVGLDHDILVPERFKAGHARSLKEFMTAPRTRMMGIGMELMGRRKDGGEFPVEIALGPLVSGGDALVLAVVRDFTEWKQLQRSLSESEERYRKLVELSPDAITIHADGKVVFSNSTGAQMFGVESAEQIIGRPVSDFVHPDSITTARERIRQVLEEGKAVPLTEEKFRRTDGSTVDVEVVSIPFSYQGRPAVQSIVRDITARKRTEQALFESEERYRKLVEFSPVGIIISAEEKVVFANPVGLKLLGAASRDELIGKKLLDMAHPDYKQVVTERRRQLLQEGKTLPALETKLVRLDGMIMDIEATSMPFSYQGKPAVQTVLRDITERKRAEQALFESEERYRKLVEFSPDGIIISAGGNVVFSNPAGLKLFGATSPDQLIGKRVIDLVHPDYRQILEERFRQLLEEHKVVPIIEEKLIRLDGVLIDIEVASMPFIYQGKPAVQSVVRDITERKRAEQAIKESEARYHGVLEAMLEGCQIIGYDYRYLYLNEAAAIHARRPREELIGRTMMEEYPGIEKTEIFPRIRECMEKRTPHHTENVFTFPDGSKGCFEISIQPVPEGVFILTMDTTERRRAEEKLQQTLADLTRSNKELEQFAYVASHDLQEPLRMVASFTQLLEKRYKGKLDAEADETIAFVVDGASRMREMINDLLEYSRVGTRGKPFEPVNSETVLAQALADLKVAVAESKAVVTHDVLPMIMADATQIVQLWENLIGNAIKFHGEDPPRIHVSARKEKGEWVFSVKDNGIGIPRESMDRLFLIFQRLHTSDKYPGTGMGLAICKKIVERHGGRIWVESEPGKGSTFYFAIPARTARG